MRNFTFIFAVITVAVMTFFFNQPVNAQGNEKMTICHCPPGNLANCHSITISINGWYAHLAEHPYDQLGPCIENADLKLIELTVSPNPYSELTKIDYTLLEESLVNIDVYSQTGTKVLTLVNETKLAGNYSQNFSAKNSGYPSGIYLLKASASNKLEYVECSKIIVETE